MKFDGDGRRTYKTFPKRFVQSAGIGHRFPFLRWCCPFCFDKPSIPLSRRGSRVPVIKVTRARTPDSDSDSDLYNEDEGSNRYGAEVPDERDAIRDKKNVVYKRGYGKKSLRDRVPKGREKFENYDLLSDDDFYQRQGMDSSSGLSSRVTSPEETGANKIPAIPLNDGAHAKKSSGFTFKKLFRGSKNKSRNQEKKSLLTESSSKIENLTVDSKYAKNRKTASNSKIINFDKGESKTNLFDESHFEGNINSIEETCSSDSDHIIIEDDAIAANDDTLEFTNLPMKRPTTPSAHGDFSLNKAPYSCESSPIKTAGGGQSPGDGRPAGPYLKSRRSTVPALLPHDTPRQKKTSGPPSYFPISVNETVSKGSVHRAGEAGVYEGEGCGGRAPPVVGGSPGSSQQHLSHRQHTPAFHTGELAPHQPQVYYSQPLQILNLMAGGTLCSFTYIVNNIKLTVY